MEISLENIPDTQQKFIFDLIQDVCFELAKKEQFREIDLQGVSLDILCDSSRVEACCKLKFQTKNQFIVYLSPTSLRNLKEVVAHELCHVFQVLSGSLVLCDKSVFWHRQEYFVAEIKHRKRPWEKEAMMFAYKYKTHK
ncbi:hypothetical protein [Vibrio tasmaniensis]|uniref:hypothetical protein n=1 Tax=Vibrio tasmaniensis TaxID=212663 RepID=UPI00037FF54E|nr:hypothetical protein [Vibrio tasmaniensis]OEF86587.1 hypothetical protein A162_08995 [Vibrio tasmaniensis 1F-155]